MTMKTKPTTSPRIDPRSIARLLLAHHPRCYPYRNDVYRLGRLELCMGCFTAYPIAIALVSLLLYFHPGPWWAWGAAGILAGSLQSLAIVGWTRSRARKFAVKTALGAGLAGTVYALVVAPWALWLQLSVFGGLVALAGVAMLPRGLQMKKTCDSCFYKADWERCPGMALVQLTNTNGQTIRLEDLRAPATSRVNANQEATSS